jgi:drug/metabolite transporter (DMT)-like permease
MEVRPMAQANLKSGVSFAFVSLAILGVMPIISNSRPPGFEALSFAFFLSVWQLLFSLPLLVRELMSTDKGIFAATLVPSHQRRTIFIILMTGMIFGLSTFVYVLAVEKAGAISAAIAIQAYPLFAILWETLFLKRRKSPLELAFTTVLLAALYFLATGGTWQVEGLSYWVILALGVPFLWSVAHVIIKEVLDRTPITPVQVTFFRVLVSSIFLGAVSMIVSGPAVVATDLFEPSFQVSALIMGLVYYLELIVWFYAVRHIDVSLASSITIPWPLVTMVLAALFLGETVEGFQAAAFCIVVASIYGLLVAGAKQQPTR